MSQHRIGIWYQFEYNYSSTIGRILSLTTNVRKLNEELIKTSGYYTSGAWHHNPFNLSKRTNDNIVQKIWAC